MFNYNTLEKDIEKLGKEVAKEKNYSENKEVPERELIKQIITPLVLRGNHSAQRQTAVSPHAVYKEKDAGLPDYLENSPAEIKFQVEKLVETVFSEGLSRAVKKAASANPFVMDAFHDALTDKLYGELKQRKLI